MWKLRSERHRWRKAKERPRGDSCFMQRTEKAQVGSDVFFYYDPRYFGQEKDRKFILVYKTYIYQNSPPVSIAHSIFSNFFFFCQYNKNCILEFVELPSLS